MGAVQDAIGKSDRPRAADALAATAPPANAPHRRKVLPPLPGPSAQLEETVPNGSDRMTLDELDDTRSERSNDDNSVSPRVEDLLLLHSTFAHALKESDTMRLHQFLDKNVEMRTMDNEIIRGQDAVLAHLVGDQVGKLSRQLQLKNSPTLSGPTKSQYTYDAGVVFRQPLLTEIIQWKRGAIITSISHILLRDVKTGSAVDLRRSFNLSSLRKSDLSNDGGCTDELRRASSGTELASEAVDVINGMPRQRREKPRPKSMSEGLAPSKRIYGKMTLYSASTSVLPLLRRRKQVNPFLIIKHQDQVIFQSYVSKRSSCPQWRNINVELKDSDISFELWDQGFFRALLMASTTVSARELNPNGKKSFSTKVELKRHTEACPKDDIQLFLCGDQVVMMEKVLPPTPVVQPQDRDLRTGVLVRAWLSLLVVYFLWKQIS